MKKLLIVSAIAISATCNGGMLDWIGLGSVEERAQTNGVDRAKVERIVTRAIERRERIRNMTDEERKAYRESLEKRRKEIEARRAEREKARKSGKRKDAAK